MKKYISIILLLAFYANVYGLEKNLVASPHPPSILPLTDTLNTEQNRDVCDCNNKKILKVMIDEPAVVRKTENIVYPYLYQFEISTYYEGLQGTLLIPCENIPEEFRVEGLFVKITGNVNNCYPWVYNFTPAPDEKIAILHNFVELISIKK